MCCKSFYEKTRVVNTWYQGEIFMLYKINWYLEYKGGDRKEGATNEAMAALMVVVVEVVLLR